MKGLISSQQIETFKSNKYYSMLQYLNYNLFIKMKL